jgi:hypothetical protein
LIFYTYTHTLLMLGNGWDHEWYLWYRVSTSNPTEYTTLVVFVPQHYCTRSKSTRKLFLHENEVQAECVRTTWYQPVIKVIAVELPVRTVLENFADTTVVVFRG